MDVFQTQTVEMATRFTLILKRGSWRTNTERKAWPMVR